MLPNATGRAPNVSTLVAEFVSGSRRTTLMANVINTSTCRVRCRRFIYDAARDRLIVVLVARAI
jgi:hypothetical protein